jgi:hypothetical protein
LADNASDDSTTALHKALFPTVCISECKDNLGAARRNRAAAWVGTDYVAFCDDGPWWDPGSLDRAVRLLDAWSNVGVLTACRCGRRRADGPDLCRHACEPLGSDGLPGPALTGHRAGARVFRSSLLRGVGGYEPRLFIGREKELVALDVLAADQAIVHCEQLTVHHHPSLSCDSGLRRSTLARDTAWIAWLHLPWQEACRAIQAALWTCSCAKATTRATVRAYCAGSLDVAAAAGRAAAPTQPAQACASR